MEIIFLAFCAFILIFNLLISMIRGTRKTVLRLLTVVIAAVGAFILARVIATNFGDEVVLWLEATVGGDPNFAPLFNGEVAASDAIAVMAKMCFAPIAFLVLFVVLKGLLIFLYWILCGVTRPDYADSAASHFIALPIGLVTALIGIFVFVSPVFGYLDVATTMASSMNAEGESASTKELVEYNEQFLTPARNTPVLSMCYDTLGEKIFDGLASAEWQDEDVQLREEIAVLADMLGNVQVLGAKSADAYGEKECAAVEALANDISASPMLSVLCSGMLSTASNHWLQGESFMGVEPPALGDNGDLLFHAFLEVFSTSNKDNIGGDLLFFANVFELAVKYNVVSGLKDADENAFATLITDSGFLADTQQLLNEHPRMAPLNVAIVDVGMRCALREMGLPEDVLATHGELMGEMTLALQAVPAKPDGTIDSEALADNLADVFAEHDLEVNEAATKLVADGVAEHFTAEELQTMTTEQMMVKLAERFEMVDISKLTNMEQVLPE